MRLRFLVLCALLALTTVAARAQVGLYFNPIVTRISNSQADTGVFAFLGANSTSRFFYGVDFGGFYEAAKTQKATVGVDVRDSIVHGQNASFNSFLLGLRVSASPSEYKFKPYVQVSVGAATSKPPTTTAHLNRATVQGYVGVDYPLAKHIDLRAVEIGYGTAQTISSGNFGGTTSFSASSLLTISSGIVFRIP